MNATETIELWPDHASDDFAWVVSEDTETTTTTKSTHQTFAEAKSAAVRLGRRRGLRVNERDRYGNSKTILSPRES